LLLHIHGDLKMDDVSRPVPKVTQYAVLHDDALNYWTGFGWEGSVDRAAHFDPVNGLATAYLLEEIFKRDLEATPVYIRAMSSSDDLGQYVINTNQAKNWPHLETAFQRVLGVTLDRDTAIALRQNAKQGEIKKVKELELSGVVNESHTNIRQR